MVGARVISDDDLAEISRRCEAATPGPWRSMVEGRDHQSGDSFIMIGVGPERREDLYLSVGDGRPASSADHDFIAAAREDVPRLLAEVDRLRNLIRM
jgi:hypothetical protein